MIVRCWGSRGSVPVSGPTYLRYGGDTTCLEIRTHSGDIVIVDAGTGIRALGNQLMSEHRFQHDIIFTHAHWDHVMGFPFFKPLYHRQTRVQIHRCPFQHNFVEEVLARIMAPPHFPVKYDDIKARIHFKGACPSPFTVGSLTVEPIPLSHPNGGSGYKFTENGRSFVFLTDNELGFRHPGGLQRDAYAAACAGADLLIHDAEFTSQEYRCKREWGHSSYRDALDLALQSGVRRLGLFHLNQDRTDEQMDHIVADCRRRIADQKSGLDCLAVSGQDRFEL